MNFNFTCMSCRVGFSDAETHRCHYKSDWHKHNLKRKVMNWDPFTYEEFEKKISLKKEQKENKSKNTPIYCKLCKKTFSCRKAIDNHLNSKKHKGALSNLPSSVNHENLISASIQTKKARKEARKSNVKDVQNEPDIEEESDIEEEFSDIEDVDSEDWEDEDEENENEISEDNPILKNNCLFCSHHSSSMTKNLKHMSFEHSFFVPDIEYVVDLRNLLLYLGEKVCQFFMCLWCNTTGRGFHSMEAAQGHMRDKGHCKVLHEGHTLAEFHPFYNYSKSYPDYDNDKDSDEEVDIPEIDTEGVYELTLPSGGTVGHRSLLTYYRQHYNSNRAIVIKRNKINKIMSTYRALGWMETDKAVAVRKAKDIKYMKAVQSKMAMRLGVKGNKLQKHFRQQVNF